MKLSVNVLADTVKHICTGIHHVVLLTCNTLCFPRASSLYTHCVLRGHSRRSSKGTLVRVSVGCGCVDGTCFIDPTSPLRFQDDQYVGTCVQLRPCHARYKPESTRSTTCEPQTPIAWATLPRSTAGCSTHSHPVPWHSQRMAQAAGMTQTTDQRIWKTRCHLGRETRRQGVGTKERRLSAISGRLSPLLQPNRWAGLLGTLLAFLAPNHRLALF